MADCSLSSHVLNTVTGKPAKGMRITLEESTGENTWRVLHSGETNSDGRITGNEFPKLRSGGVYRLSFDTSRYFESEGVKEYFYPVARIEFFVKQGHYHVPLLVSPFSYSTYRGS